MVYRKGKSQKILFEKHVMKNHDMRYLKSALQEKLQSAFLFVNCE